MSDLKVLVLGPDATFVAAVRDILAAELPLATCDGVDSASLRTAPEASALVIDARADAADGVELGARQRAIGFAGAIVVVCEASDRAVAAAVRYGYAAVSPHELAQQLVSQLAAQLLQAESPHAEQVMRARRLVAAGEIAARLQHALNNALMGLLAEAQLMQLDELSDEHAAALERMVTISRRMIELTRSLDGLSERKRTV